MQSLVHIQSGKFRNIYMFVISNRKSFIPQILKVASPLRKKLIYFSPLGFEIQKNITIVKPENLSSTRSELFNDIFRTDKNPTHSWGTASIFQFSDIVFERTLIILMAIKI